MRFRVPLSVVVGLAAVWVTSSGCGRDPAPPADQDDLLVFTIGGDSPTLRSRLRMPPLKRSDVFEKRPEKRAQKVPRRPGPTFRPLAPTPEREVPRTAKLRPGETIVGLCKRVLGDGNRYPEVLKLNGWTEQQARRLPRGAEVKLPTR